MSSFNVVATENNRFKLVSGLAWRKSFEGLVTEVLNSEFMPVLNFPDVEISGEVTQGKIVEIMIKDKKNGNHINIDNPELDEQGKLKYKQLFFLIKAAEKGEWAVVFNGGGFSCNLQNFQSDLSYQPGLFVSGELIRTDIISKKHLICEMVKDLEHLFLYYTAYSPQSLLDRICNKLDISASNIRELTVKFGGSIDVLRVKCGELEEAMKRGGKDGCYTVRLDALHTVTYEEKEFSLEENQEYQRYTINWHKTFKGMLSTDDVKAEFERAKMEIVELLQEVALWNEKRAKELEGLG